jgi:hypothetical protein
MAQSMLATSRLSEGDFIYTALRDGKYGQR